MSEVSAIDDICTRVISITGGDLWDRCKMELVHVFGYLHFEAIPEISACDLDYSRTNTHNAKNPTMMAHADIALYRRIQWYVANPVASYITTIASVVGGVGALGRVGR